MKEILIDLYKIKNIYSGLGQFSINFAKELMLQLPEGTNVNFLIPKNSKFKTIETIKHTNANFQKRYFPSLNKDYAIWHSLHQFPSHLPNKKTKQILTIHDLNFLIEKKEGKKQKYLNKLQKNVDRADYITTISNYTKKIIEQNINLKGKKIKVIYNGVSIESGVNSVKPKFVREKSFFFSIGIFSEKKNFHVLLPLMKYFENSQLIIAGNNDTEYGRKIKEQINNLNLKDKVILPGKISNSEKYWLYNNCEAFLFPSLAEGFGMPVTEAMMFGKPVFLSKHTCLPEIGGEMAYYFDNFNKTYMSDIIQEKLTCFFNQKDSLIRAIQEYAGKFDWKTCINQYMQLYAECCANSES